MRWRTCTVQKSVVCLSLQKATVAQGTASRPAAPMQAVFETHLNKHTGPRPYYCSGCKRQVATREELERHVEHDCDGGLDLPRMLSPGAFENAIPEACGSASTNDVLATDGERNEGDSPSC